MNRGDVAIADFPIANWKTGAPGALTMGNLQLSIVNLQLLLLVRLHSPRYAANSTAADAARQYTPK